MRSAVWAGLAGLLTACGTAPAPEPVVRTVEVTVQVPVSCVPPGLRVAPSYPDTREALKAQPGAAERYNLMAAGRLLRDQRLAELEPVVAACREAAPPP